MAEITSALHGGTVTAPSSPLDPRRAPHRRRRPSGEPPPLPYELGRSGRRWLWLGAAVVVMWILFAVTGLGRWVDQLDHWLIERIVSIRSRGLTSVADQIEALGSARAELFLRWTVLLVAVVFRRFRHLVAFIACILVSTWITAGIEVLFTRPRPWGVEILGSWTGFAHPSRPMCDLAVALIGIAYTIAPRGAWRSAVKVGAAVYLSLLAAARLYLAVEFPTDTLFGTIVGVAVSLVIFRVFVPYDSFPVRYGGGKTAHLDVGGRRGEALLKGLREQLGLEAVSVKQFALDGSAGSTPLRITLAHPEGTALFGKLYAKNHLRSDRWYKLFRTLVYGRLEDESTFSSVRRLVQYEDYLLRLMREAGIPTAKPYGFVEITPEREYLLVTEFLDGATEITKAKVDDKVIDDALCIVRCLWDSGLAHRDIKPANVLVRDQRVLLIDVAFAEIRPSPWRQAVDLANMMLVLALGSDPEHVYERATRIFTPEEIGEAFAATRGIALTSQLRARLRQDGRDLVTRFRELAPPTPPVRIQRWSVRRIGLTVAVIAVILIALQITVGTFQATSLL